MPTHVVRQGECLSLIAQQHGFHWRTLWEANPALHADGRSPNVLRPGDELTIPERRQADQPLPLGARSRFVRRAGPARLQLRLQSGDDRLGGEPFTLLVADRTIEGTTGPDGEIDCPIPAGAEQAVLVVGAGAGRHEFRLRLGQLDPPATVEGAQARLNNLGYDCGAVDGQLGPRTRASLRAYQRRAGLPASGELDEATLGRLRADYPV